MGGQSFAFSSFLLLLGVGGLDCSFSEFGMNLISIQCVRSDDLHKND